jgi:hypothetical protein
MPPNRQEVQSRGNQRWESEMNTLLKSGKPALGVLLGLVAVVATLAFSAAPVG